MAHVVVDVCDDETILPWANVRGTNKLRRLIASFSL